jgi:hypothetical protein
MKCKVRFHLASGENYRKWQVIDGGRVSYFDPDSVSLTMTGCRLKNRRKTAESIFAGAQNKTVCAWIACDHVEATAARKGDETAPENSTLLAYNPRVLPHWASALEGGDLDGASFGKITSFGRTLLATN